MAVQDTNSVMTPSEAKAQLLELGAQWDAEKKARGPLGTWRGKAVVGGAVGALVFGWLAAGAAKRLLKAPPPARITPFSRWQSRGWRPRDPRDVKKAALGGVSLGLLLKLAKPLLPHLAQYATRHYAHWRAAKVQAGGRTTNGRRSDH